MRELHIHLSKHRFMRLYRAVDRNKDGTVTYDEFYRVIFPEEAMKQEQEGLRLLRERRLTEEKILTVEEMTEVQEIAKMSDVP